MASFLSFGYGYKSKPHRSYLSVTFACLYMYVCDLLCVLEGWHDTEGGVNSSSVGRGDNGRQSTPSCVFVALWISCGKVSASLIYRSSLTFINHTQPKNTEILSIDVPELLFSLTSINSDGCAYTIYIYIYSRYFVCWCSVSSDKSGTMGLYLSITGPIVSLVVLLWFLELLGHVALFAAVLSQCVNLGRSRSTEV